MQQTILWTQELPFYPVPPFVDVRIRGSKEATQEAAQKLLESGLVAFATETVYGLGANALDEAALKKVFQAKGRPQDNPLIAHVSSLDQVEMLASSVSARAQALMEAFWPGPLSILFPVRKQISQVLTAGLDHVAIRMPDHPQALALIHELGAPIAAPSANLSGRPSPTMAHHVLDDLAGRIAGVMDGGSCDVGIESTVVELQDDHIVILRPGRIAVSDLSEFGVDVVFDPYLEHGQSPAAPRAPGQKYRHYAPAGQLTVYIGDDALRLQKAIMDDVQAYRQQGLQVAVLSLEKDFRPDADLVWYLGSRESFADIEKNLYKALRECDARHVDRILAQGVPDTGRYRAVMNRLYKAAGGNLTIVS